MIGLLHSKFWVRKEVNIRRVLFKIGKHKLLDQKPRLSVDIMSEVMIVNKSHVQNRAEMFHLKNDLQ